MEDEIICTCNEITKGTIVNAIREKNLTTVEQVQEETTAGTVCGGCIDDIQSILDEINAK
jgi:NAD(P)H-nitrite reductase large subunit